MRGAVGRALAALRSQSVAVALSGGRDSCALLHACASLAREAAVGVAAIHVHHGLSPHAGAWTAACRTLAADCGAELVVRHVAVPPNDPRGVEAAARHARYEALRDAARELRASAILLAHHEDDQAETLLLQALRGAGPHGLAAMPAERVDEDGLRWLRPLLGVPRAAIDTYVASHALAFVDDDSNASPRHRRNALRNAVLPALRAAFPEATHTLARAAAHQAEAAVLLDELAEVDARDAVVGGALRCAVLARLSPERARNLLRAFLRTHGLPAPSTARLHAMLQQLVAPRRDARILLRHAGAHLGVHDGRIVVHAPPPCRYEVRWQGESELALPHGTLTFSRTRGEGLDATRLACTVVSVSPRRGGERLVIDERRPRRALASWLYELRLPAWERDAWPLVYCDNELVAVPRVGIAPAFRAAPGSDGYALDWRPATRGVE